MLCDRFAVAWRRAESPLIEDYLEEFGSSPGARTLLRELILVELDVKRELGELATRQQYCARFSHDAPTVEEAFSRAGGSEAGGLRETELGTTRSPEQSAAQGRETRDRLPRLVWRLRVA